MDYQAENYKKSIMNKKEMIGEDQNTHTLFNSPSFFFFLFTTVRLFIETLMIHK